MNPKRTSTGAEKSKGREKFHQTILMMTSISPVNLRFHLPAMTQASSSNIFNDHQRETRNAFTQAVRDRPRQLILDYRELHGHVVSASLAAGFAPGYPESIHEIAELSVALDEPANELVELVWQSVVTEAAVTAESGNSELTALVIAGPKGSGITNLMRSLDREIAEHAQAILFTTLADAMYVYKLIEEALAASEQMHVLVAYIHRPIELCSAAMLQQVIETGETAPLDQYGNDIYEAQSGIKWLEDRYRYNSKVQVKAIDASGPIHGFHPMTPAAVKREQKTIGETKKIITEAFAKEYAQQRWTDARLHAAVYKTLTGEEAPTRTWQVTKPGHSQFKGQLRGDAAQTARRDEPAATAARAREREIIAAEPQREDERGPTKYARSSLHSRPGR